MIETRKSISRPRALTLKRPSCGTRRSAMSSSATTLMREIICSASSSPESVATVFSTPSMRYLIDEAGGAGFEVDVGGAALQRVVERRARDLDDVARVLADGLERQVLDAGRAAHAGGGRGEHALHGVERLFLAGEPRRDVRVVGERPGEILADPLLAPGDPGDVERIAEDEPQIPGVIAEEDRLRLERLAERQQVERGLPAVEIGIGRDRVGERRPETRDERFRRLGRKLLESGRPRSSRALARECAPA